MCLENRPRRSEKVYYHGDNGSLGCVDWIHGWSEAGIFLLPWWLETIMLGTEIQIGNSGSESSVALPPASFDVCYCSEVIEHLFNVQGFVAEVHRLLKDGGMLVLTTPYHGWLKNLLVVTLRFDQHFSPTGGHIRFFSKKSMRQCLERGGFLAEEIMGTGRMWPLWNSMLITARKTDEKP